MMGKVASQSSSTVDLSDYIGYKVCFTEAVNLEGTIVRDMNRLNIGPMRTNQGPRRSPFAPYYATARRLLKSQCSKESESSLADQVPSLDVERNGPRSPWGKLVSITKGFPDISLFVASTIVGKIVDVVDIITGERKLDPSEHLCACHR